MKKLCAALTLAVLAGCGVETATTAAASAEIKRRELEQARKTMQQAKQKIEQNTQQIMERTSQTDDKVKD